MKIITIKFKTGINISITCVSYNFNKTTNNHELVINSNDVTSIIETPEKENITGVRID